MDDLISRQSAINEIKSLFLNVPYSEKNIAWSMALTIIRQLPSAQPETHDKRTKTHSCDCIERQAALD